MSNTSTVGLDQAKVEAFAARMLDVVNGASVAMMTSIGHRTGLFDTLAEMPPATSQQIADRTGMHERYVREWLGAMVTGGVVQYEPTAQTYVLPAEHAAVLTRAAKTDNIASTTQWISVLGQVEDKVVDCFRDGGGVHYCEYDRFHEVMAEESAQTVAAALLDHILPLAQPLAGALEQGIEVLDVGCGSGRALNLLAARFPQSRFTGYDFCDDAISAARAEADQRALRNVCFDAKDVAAIGRSEAFDLITAFDAIHDQADPSGVLSEIARALRPDGTFLMQDIATSSHLHKNLEHPIGPFLYTISCMHCMTVSLAQGGAGLGTCWGEELACDMLKLAGFTTVSVHRLPHDIINSYYIATKS